MLKVTPACLPAPHSFDPLHMLQPLALFSLTERAVSESSVASLVKTDVTSSRETMHGCSERARCIVRLTASSDSPTSPKTQLASAGWTCETPRAVPSAEQNVDFPLPSSPTTAARRGNNSGA
eukprot:m.304318 g.304318  ORF g.304318 m.304318 type:complete len:122 (+) comp15898_c0_seq1:179-544(+)